MCIFLWNRKRKKITLFPNQKHWEGNTKIPCFSKTATDSWFSKTRTSSSSFSRFRVPKSSKILGPPTLVQSTKVLNYTHCDIICHMELETWYGIWDELLKCGFHMTTNKKSFIMNALLVSYPFPVIRFGWVCCCTHPQGMTGNGQLTRGTFMINDFLRNPHFRE